MQAGQVRSRGSIDSEVGRARNEDLAIGVYRQSLKVGHVHRVKGGVETAIVQKPHDRDEVYLIARGTAVFFDGAGRVDVGAGAFLFVAAGQPHRFENFSADFACWVLFYGPVGGDAAARDR